MSVTDFKTCMRGLWRANAVIIFNSRVFKNLDVKAKEGELGLNG